MKRKLKIIITLPLKKRGGPFVSQSRIMESSLKEEFDFYPLYIPRIRELLKPKVFFGLIKEIQRISPDIYHFYGLQMDGFFSMLLLKFASKKTPTVLVVRGSSDEAEKFNPLLRFPVKFMEYYTLRKATIVYGVSKYVSSWKKVKKLNQKYIGHIHNFLPKQKDLDDYCLEEMRKNLGIKNEDTVVVSTGRIEVEKGYKDLKDVISFDNYRDNVVFLIIGEGSYLDEIRKIRSLVKSRVIFTGHVNNVLPYLMISDIFVLLSWHETLGNSIIEALAQGLPCIVTNVGGIPELVENNLNGYLVQVGDIINTNKVLKLAINNIGEFKDIKATIKRKINDKTIETKLNNLYRKIAK
ncbi:MAG: glycosyltransferase family 4 protein [Halanaerobiales bacterium]|nr:glycosyltransferase family 4 protein [Halanaerobiales bacterium]